MRIPRADERRETGFQIAADDESVLVTEAGSLVERALGVQWYEEHGNAVDRAALALCRLRRASAGQRGAAQHGDQVVRDVLAQSSTGALLWLASRAISYMDESGFPEAVGPWFPEEVVDKS